MKKLPLLKKNLIYFFYTILFLVCINANADVINVPAGGDIQAAINAISVGGTVNLASGTYPLTAQLVINKSMTLNGAGINSTIIQSPDTVDLTTTFNYIGPITTTTYTPIIIVENATDVFLQNFEVDGRDQNVFGVVRHFAGVGYHDASGTISNLHVLNILESTEPRGYQEGSGIVLANDTGTNNVTVQNCLINDFQKQGILAIGTGLNATINQNVILGTNVEANPNGIELYDGSTGIISNNTVTDLTNPSTEQCAGILVFGSNNLTIEGNTVGTNDNGIYLLNCDNLKLLNNTLTDNIFNITLDDTGATNANTSYLTGNMISNNVPLSAQTYGVLLYSPSVLDVNPQSFFNSNTFKGSTFGLVVNGNSTDTAGPIVRMHNDTFLDSSPIYYIQMVSCPNDIWPSTQTVSFNGLISGEMTLAQFNALVTNPITQQIYDKNTDPTLGLVLTYVVPAPPTITAVSPSSGQFRGGTAVMITGTNFIRGAQLFFGSELVTQFDVISDTLIIAITPPGIGTVPVTVTTANGTSPVVPASHFTYASQILLPKVTGLNPNSGPTTGNTSVAITGTNFFAGAHVYFGGQPATNVDVVSSTLIIATSPPGVGVVPVTVTTTLGSSHPSIAGNFTYIPPVIENPLPPTAFHGIIKKNKFATQADYELFAKWDASPSVNVVSYEIYKDNRLVKTVSADSYLFYTTHVKPGKKLDYTVVAVSSNGKKSIPAHLKIKHKN